MGKNGPAIVHIDLTPDQAQAAAIALGAQLEKWKELQVTKAWSPRMGHVMELCQAVHDQMITALKAGSE